VFGDLAGKPLDTPALQKRLASQYRLDRFESVDYRLIGNEAERGLEIDLRRKAWGPTFLRLGVGVENDYEGGATANAAAQLTLTNLNALDAEWTVDAQVGEEPRLLMEFYQPLSMRNTFFVAPGFRYELETLPEITADGRRVARFRTRDTEVTLATGAQLANWGEVRVGLRRGDGSVHVLVGDPQPPASYDLGGAFVQFGYDRLDSAYFPKQGQAFRASWLADRESLGASYDADIVQASWQLARSRDRYSLVWSMDAGSALDDTVVSPQELFTLGGFLELSGLPSDALVGTQYGIARAILYRRISRGGTGFFEISGIPRRVVRGRQCLADARRCRPWQSADGRQLVSRRRHPVRATLSRGGTGQRWRNGVLPVSRQDVLAARGQGLSAKMPARLESRIAMSIANAQNLRQPLPEVRPWGLRVRARKNDPFRNLVGDDWEKEHWFPTRAERDAAWRDMSGRYVYFRPGDVPTLDFELIDPPASA
jgi:hypothetical protein